MDKPITRSCVDCASTGCSNGPGFPNFCLSTENINQEALDCALDLYKEPENLAMMVTAANIECEFYCQMTRVEEIIEFAKRMNYKKIGIATCVGLISESRTLARILRSHGLEVFGVACKAGMVKKTAVGIDKKCEQIGENMCNPIHQAKRLNAEHTELNIIMGLCVGHDCLFTKYSEAPVTTLIAKDRVLGHNPAAALYNADTYYKKLFKKD